MFLRSVRSCRSAGTVIKYLVYYELDISASCTNLKSYVRFFLCIDRASKHPPKKTVKSSSWQSDKHSSSKASKAILTGSFFFKTLKKDVLSFFLSVFLTVPLHSSKYNSQRLIRQYRGLGVVTNVSKDLSLVTEGRK